MIPLKNVQVLANIKIMLAIKVPTETYWHVRPYQLYAYNTLTYRALFIFFYIHVRYYKRTYSTKQKKNQPSNDFLEFRKNIAAHDTQ